MVIRSPRYSNYHIFIPKQHQPIIAEDRTGAFKTHSPEGRVEFKSCFLEAHLTGESTGKNRYESVIAQGQCTD